MAKLSELKSGINDRQKVNLWLDHINETDELIRADVLEKCANDEDARQYFVGRYEHRGNHDRQVPQ